MQWHGDHWDELVEYSSPYIDMWPGDDWLFCQIRRGNESVSNEYLYDHPESQYWREKLGGLSRNELPTLSFGQWRDDPPEVPLFRDEETGDDYQIALHLDTEEYLIYASCPREDPVPFDERAKPLIKVIYQESSAETTPRYPGLPRFVIPLGPLAVRTRSRYTNPVAFPVTELTDYQVVIDAENEAMPLWLLCSRRTLKERHQAVADCNAKKQLPIFKGLMQFEKFGYDAACLLDSVHRLGGSLSYEETCDMIRRTRAVVDPVWRDATMEKMEELIGGQVLDNVD